MSELEDTLLLAIRGAGLPIPEREYRFAAPRRWRFDFCYPDRKLAIECQGGIYSGGRHARGYGIDADLEKHNAAVLRGWDVLYFTSSMINGGLALDTLRQALG